MTTTVFITGLPRTITHGQLRRTLLQYVSPVSVSLAKSAFGSIARVEVLTGLDSASVLLAVEHGTVNGVRAKSWLGDSARGEALAAVFSSPAHNAPRVKRTQT
jgi:hypothetical protein